LIASHVDGTIIVIEANVVKCQNALRMKEQLVRANANILGVVLNKISKSEYKNYYGSYDYYNSKKKYIKKWSQLIKNLKNLKRENMIDIHCHIVFGVDDGPTTIKDSVRMILEAEKIGVDKIIVTPLQKKRL